MRNWAEIRRAKEEELLTLAKRRVEKFTILKRIYNDEFLSNLVQHKNDSDNLLLLWLVIDNTIDCPIAIRLFQEIEENLKLLQYEERIQLFKTKLRQWDTIAFESAILELEFIVEYIKNGYQIKLEPLLPNNRRGDFSISKNAIKIYFEAKSIYWKPSLKEQAITNEFSDRLFNMNEPFAVNINIKKNFQRNQIVKTVKHIQQKLKEVEETSINLPFSFVCSEKGEPIVCIDVICRFPEGEKGIISRFGFGAKIKKDWRNLRRKITSGIPQLHPNYPGVIIIKPHGPDTSHDDVQNAIFGDLKKFFVGEPQLFRGRDCIFTKNKNKRLSAIVYYEKRLQDSGYTKKKFVYHNPHAKVKVSPEVFKGENVT